MADLKDIEYKELLEAIVNVKNIDDAKDFLSDLLTIQESEALGQRVHAANLLISGMTYQEVTQETKISSATLARINKCIKYGKGYNKILKK
jgi:TrpR-related protein YerC/YecD